MNADYAALLRRRAALVALLALATTACLLADLGTGPSGLSPAELLRWITRGHAAAAGAAVDPRQIIVWDIRLPQGLLAVAVGLALGLAGAEMQTVLDNPLASPFTLGLSEAAAFGAALAIVLDVGIPGVPAEAMVTANAFVFALAAALLLDGVTRWLALPASSLVLFGIALVFSFNALLWLLQYVASAEALQALVFWVMGSLQRATWTKVGLLLGLAALLLPWALRDAWALTALRLGEERAASFGVDVRRLRLRALLRVALLAATAVSFAGTIGFIGLVAPHVARRLCGEDHRFYLPAAALVGAFVLSAAAIASKLVVPGAVIPVGIVTALIGIPFFLAIVLRTRAGFAS